MLQLTNRTSFAASMAVLADENGLDTLYVTIKASFTLGKQWQLAEEQLPVQEADEYLGEPGESSLLSPSDIHIGKVSTDILVTGDAMATDGQAVRHLQAGVSVGSVQKIVQVLGDRVWEGNRPSQPQVFDRMPLTYERAYGGRVVEQDQVVDAEVRNPVGIGFYNSAKPMQQGDPLPNVEDPAALIASPRDKPKPAGFGPIAPNWQPRVQYAGTYDDAWTEQRAPYLPSDFDKRFLNAAHPDLVYPGFLQGGEPIHIANMHPMGTIKVQLPYVQMLCRAEIGSQQVDAAPQLETLWLKPNDLQAHLVWKACMPCGKHLSKIKQVTVSLRR